MTPWVYALQTAGWCLAGFVAGFLVGRTARDVHRIADAVTTEGDHVAENNRRPWWDRINSRVVVAVFVVGLGVLTVGQGLAQSAALRRITECNIAFANQFADALEARSVSSQDAQNALDELMTVVGQLGSTPPTSAADLEARRETYRKAITGYLAKRAEAKEQQQKNPFPKPPRESCPH